MVVQVFLQASQDQQSLVVAAVVVVFTKQGQAVQVAQVVAVQVE
jgi:hypothetical protein